MAATRRVRIDDQAGLPGLAGRARKPRAFVGVRAVDKGAEDRETCEEDGTGGEDLHATGLPCRDGVRMDRGLCLSCGDRQLLPEIGLESRQAGPRAPGAVRRSGLQV